MDLYLRLTNSKRDGCGETKSSDITMTTLKSAVTEHLFQAALNKRPTMNEKIEDRLTREFASRTGAPVDGWKKRMRYPGRRIMIKQWTEVNNSATSSGPCMQNTHPLHKCCVLVQYCHSYCGVIHFLIGLGVCSREEIPYAVLQS